MQTLVFEVGEEARIDILSIGGDLRLSGREENQVELKAPSGADLSINQDGNQLSISCPSDCLIFLPRNSEVEVHAVGGDVRVTNVAGELNIRTVGGDLSLRGHGEATIETIGGNFHARKGSNDLNVERIGGDALVDRISGSVLLRSIGGDLRLRRVDGSVDLVVGGDASLMFTTLGGEMVKVHVGGDLSCNLPSDASATVKLSCGGVIHTPETIQPEQPESDGLYKLGDGEIQVDLIAGGDLWFQADNTGEAGIFANLGDSIAFQVESELEAGIAEVEAKMEAIGAGMGSFPSERIGEQVRRAVTRARRKSEGARRKSKRVMMARRGTFQTKSEGRGMGVSEDERLSILRMLEKGIITVEEAEKLLQTLEGES
jgi:hypothetical protein